MLVPIRFRTQYHFCHWPLASVKQQRTFLYKMSDFYLKPAESRGAHLGADRRFTVCFIHMQRHTLAGIFSKAFLTGFLLHQKDR